MKKIFFISLLIFANILMANDSLYQVLDTAKNIEIKLKTLNRLAWIARRYDLKEADSLAKISIELAKDNDYEVYYADAFNTLGVLDLMQGRIEEGVKKLNECAKINLRLKQNKAYLDNRMNIGLTYYFRGDLDSASIIMWDIHKMADSLNEITIKKQLYHNLSNIYKDQGKYFEALDVAFKSIENAKNQGDESEISSNYNSIGLIYDYLGNLEKAKYYHYKSLDLNIANNDIDGLSSSYGNIGELHRQEGSWDSAYYCYRKALDYCKQLNDSGCIAGQLMNLSICFENKKDFDSSRVLIEQSLEISQKIGYGYQIILANNMLGVNLMSQDKPLQAIPLFKKSLKVALLQEMADIIQANYDGLYRSYDQLKQYDSSLYYLEKFVELKDSLESIEAKEKVDLLETQFRTAEKEKSIALLNESKSKNELEISNQRNWIILLIGGILSLVLISLLVIQRNKRRAQAEKDAILIEEQEKGISAVFNAQEEERKRISKDLHDGVGQQLSGLKMAFQKLGSDLKVSSPEKRDEVEKLSLILSESADEVRSISHQMMPKALTELGLIEALEDMLSKSLGINDIKYQFEYFGITERLNERLEISLYRVAQELINNIIKHSKANNVSVQLFKNAGKIILVLEDNGTGIKNEKGDGHGLLNIRSRINTLKGEINLEPSPNSGTLATVRIPIK